VCWNLATAAIPGGDHGQGDVGHDGPKGEGNRLKDDRGVTSLEDSKKRKKNSMRDRGISAGGVKPYRSCKQGVTGRVVASGKTTG